MQFLLKINNGITSKLLSPCFGFIYLFRLAYSILSAVNPLPPHQKIKKENAMCKHECSDLHLLIIDMAFNTPRITSVRLPSYSDKSPYYCAITLCTNGFTENKTAVLHDIA